MLSGMTRLLGDIGTIEWCRRTNGILAGGERIRFLAAVGLRTAHVLPRMLAARAGVRGSGPDPSEQEVPDTAFTRAVLQACARLDPMIVQHGYRSFRFARALGLVEGLRCDPEPLFAAAVLHDYAFATMDTLTERCFTLAGADAAAGVLASSGLPASVQHDVLDAITLHLNPSVGAEQGVLQHLLHDGVLVDVLGLRSWDLDPAGIRRVADRHPRHGFVRRGEPLLRAHGRRVHGCRASALFTMGFGPALRLAGWRSVEAREPTSAPRIAEPGR